MVVRRKKKSRKYRGYRNQGYGSIGQHRKSGSRGGVGLVGYHKHKWSWTVKYFPDWYGKHGFTRPPTIRTVYRTMNIGELGELLKEMESRGLLNFEEDKVIVDLSAFGINKLLGRGTIDRKVKVVVYDATRQAIEKIQNAGGEIVLLKETSK
jgi:large subunit ribosomal protein L15